jgi:hypothetical protein
MLYPWSLSLGSRIQSSGANLSGRLCDGSVSGNVISGLKKGCVVGSSLHTSMHLPTRVVGGMTVTAGRVLRSQIKRLPSRPASRTIRITARDKNLRGLAGPASIAISRHWWDCGFHRWLQPFAIAFYFPVPPIPPPAQESTLDVRAEPDPPSPAPAPIPPSPRPVAAGAQHSPAAPSPRRVAIASVHGVAVISNRLNPVRVNAKDSVQRTGVQGRTRRFPAGYSRRCPRL